MPVGVSTYPDDVLSGQKTPEDQKNRRHGEITAWLAAFAENCEAFGGMGITYAADITEIINSHYWEAMDENVRPRIQSSMPDSPVRADRHKIAALMELVIMHAQPILHADARIANDLTARLAFFVAMNILGNWNKSRVGDLYVSDSFDREHRTWLRQLHTHSEGWPIFSNAATWYLVELIYFERSARAS